MNWRKENDVLVMETGKRITFDFPIKGIVGGDTLTCLDVHLDVPADQLGTENVYYISKENGDIEAKDCIDFSHIPKHLEDKNKAVHEKCAMDWAKEGETLIIENETCVSFDYPIEAIFETCGILIVVLDNPPKQSMTENVFAVSKEGKILWQIERTPKTAHPVSRYTSVRETSVAGIVCAWNWNCTNVYIDVKTGKVLDTESKK
jgi:hypothetical protein